ncbi:MAG: KOW domain-containing RNA-binding protein [Peptoniphilaceae bacterium]|nr:KOW domain-containing RNA-binding protein [Peptoniphilaceae bacterium]
MIKSKCGRDKDGIFVIKQILDNDYVLLIDGDERKIEKPKRKNIKHISKINMTLDDYKTMSNGELKKAIKLFKEGSVNVKK